MLKQISWFLLNIEMVILFIQYYKIKFQEKNIFVIALRKVFLCYCFSHHLTSYQQCIHHANPMVVVGTLIEVFAASQMILPWPFRKIFVCWFGQIECRIAIVRINCLIRASIDGFFVIRLFIDCNKYESQHSYTIYRGFVSQRCGLSESD